MPIIEGDIDHILVTPVHHVLQLEHARFSGKTGNAAGHISRNGGIFGNPDSRKIARRSNHIVETGIAVAEIHQPGTAGRLFDFGYPDPMPGPWLYARIHMQGAVMGLLIKERNPFGNTVRTSHEFRNFRAGIDCDSMHGVIFVADAFLPFGSGCAVIRIDTGGVPVGSYISVIRLHMSQFQNDWLFPVNNSISPVPSPS